MKKEIILSARDIAAIQADIEGGGKSKKAPTKKDIMDRLKAAAARHVEYGDRLNAEVREIRRKRRPAKVPIRELIVKYLKKHGASTMADVYTGIKRQRRVTSEVMSDLIYRGIVRRERCVVCDVGEVYRLKGQPPISQKYGSAASHHTVEARRAVGDVPLTTNHRRASTRMHGSRRSVGGRGGRRG